MTKDGTSTYTTIEFDIADDYLEYLSLTNDRWFKNDAIESHWIFRGQNNADAHLMPSLYRRHKQENKYNRIFDKSHLELGAMSAPDLKIVIENYANTSDVKGEKFKIRLQEIIKSTFVELSLTEDFLKRANAANLNVPTLKLFKQQNTDISSLNHFYFNLMTTRIKSFVMDDNNFLFENRENYTGDKRFIYCKPFYEIDYPEAFALSRHHGIPGRYLDWTRDPFYAAYFSAQKVKNERNGKICVWALNTDTLAPIKFHKYLHHSGLKFLYRQRGLFTEMFGVEGYYYLNGHWPSLEDYLQLDDSPVNYYLYKITLPTSQAENVLKALKRAHIDSYYLMPTYDNVTKSILSEID